MPQDHWLPVEEWDADLAHGCMMMVSDLIKTREMPDDALVALEVNGVYALTRNVQCRSGEDGKQSVVWLRAHHIRLAASDFRWCDVAAQ
jgi:hypothetical protein